MSVFNDFHARIAAILEGLAADGTLPSDLDLSRLTVELPRDRSHGDLATNAALVLAKPAGLKPRDLAEKIVAGLRADPDVEAADVAGPGFVNLTLGIGYWQQVVADIVRKGTAFGRPNISDGAPVNVEYVSANPTGPMHVGHCRGAVFGDALANVLAFAGYAVTREYYINDAGAQVDTLARSAYLRYREALGEDIGKIPEGLYPGDYLKAAGEKLKDEHGSDLLGKEEAAWLPICRDTAIDVMMEMIRGDLAALAIHHDVFFSERTLIHGDVDRVAEAIEELRRMGLIYKGRLERPKGDTAEDWEDREQTLFESTRFGDDSDRALMKSDGSYTYFANDIAYHFDKFQRGFTQMVDIWGADHGGYIRRMKAAVQAITGGQGNLDVEVCQMVRLLRDGQTVEMSKRSGEFVTLRDVVDEVGADPVRFMMLYRKADAPLEFDFKKVTEQSRDNPVFYVQYAHARCFSVFRQAADAFGGEDMRAAAQAASAADLDHLVDPAEIGLIKTLSELPTIMGQAAQHREPHRIAFYLYQVAGEFHALWNRGKDLPQLRFINESDRALTLARLALVESASVVIRTGLDVLGVSAPETM